VAFIIADVRSPVDAGGEAKDGGGLLGEGGRLFAHGACGFFREGEGEDM